MPVYVNLDAKIPVTLAVKTVFCANYMDASQRYVTCDITIYCLVYVEIQKVWKDFTQHLINFVKKFQTKNQNNKNYCK